MFASNIIHSVNKMKALDIMRAHDLKWDNHIADTIAKSQVKLSLMRKIRPFISMDQFLQIATSQIFSTTYYASPVWLNNTLASRLWKKVNSFHYRVMRVACNDFRTKISKKVIDSTCKRATPKMWSQYISASTAIKILRDSTPRLLAEALQQSMTVERRRPRHGRFFDCSRRKPGRHSFNNRLVHLNSIAEPWLDPFPTNDSIRIILKQHLNFDFKLDKDNNFN